MNMDRFKFRAWNKNTGTMVDLQKITPLAIVEYVKNTGVFVPFDSEALILMQCTGLKDSEGNLIYESDIVRIKYDDERLSYISPVMWKHGAWCIYHEFRVDYQTGERSCVGFGYWIPEALKRVTALGNIYEHPSLLEADKK